MRDMRARWAVLMVVACSLSSFSRAQTAPDIRQLEQGKPIERELAGGEVHAYSIQLTEGQFLSVVVDQLGIDVVVQLFAPDGRALEEVDGPTGAQGPEAVSALVQVSGLYRLQVGALEKRARPSRYQVRIGALRKATSDDKKVDRVKALAITLATVKTEDEGLALLAKENDLFTAELSRRLSASGKTQKLPQALITYALSLSVAERAGYREGIAESHTNIGATYLRQGNVKSALEHLHKSLPLIEELGDKRGLSVLLRSIGEAYRQQGNFEKALQHYQRNLTVNQELGGKPGTAVALTDLGVAYRMRGTDLGLASDSLQRSLKLYEELQSKVGMATSLVNLGDIFLAQRDYARAFEHVQKSLTLFEEASHTAGIGAR